MTGNAVELAPVSASALEELLSAQDEKSGRRVIVSAREVKKTYTLGAIPTHALRGVNLDVFAGEYLSIMGPSGSGKSTFFNMIGGLDKPTSGKVFIDEVDIAQLDAFELAWLRCRKVGYIFQTYNLIPVMTCLENVMLPMTFVGMNGDDARDKAVDLLKLVGLGERLKHKPPQLSGGQQQRVACARALANDPALILADEPTANLDTRTGEELIDLLHELKARRGVTIISATHDMKMLSVSDRVVWIRDGLCERIEERKDLEIKVGSVVGSRLPVVGNDKQAKTGHRLQSTDNRLPPLDVIISLRQVKRIYRLEDEEIQALCGVDLDIYRGEYLSIMGPSGSGKSTLFNMVGGLDRPSAGSIELDGQNLAAMDELRLAWLRCNRIGYIFQTFNLLPSLSALDNVALPLIFTGSTPAEAQRHAAQVLERVGLGDRLDHRPSELSGGQQQRVACARAIANNPAVILADEPTGNLDLKTGEEILALLKELQRQHGTTIICATHDMKMLNASDRVIWIRDGRVDRVAHRDELQIEIGTMNGQLS